MEILRKSYIDRITNHTTFSRKKKDFPSASSKKVHFLRQTRYSTYLAKYLFANDARNFDFTEKRGKCRKKRPAANIENALFFRRRL